MFTIVALIQYNLLLCLVTCFLNIRIFKQDNFSLRDFNWSRSSIFILLIMAVFAGIREVNEGIDYQNYLEFYNYIDYHGEFSKYLKRNEIGWDYLNYIFAKIGIPAELFFGFIAGLMWYFFIKGSYKFYFLLPLMLFFILTTGNYFSTYNTIRQFLAVMIFFYSIKFIIEQEFIKYIFWIVFASLFHSSAIILLPLYFLYKVSFNQKYVFILYILSLFFLGNRDIINYLLDIIINFGSSIEFFAKYVYYMGSDKLDTADRMVGTGLGFILRVGTDIYLIYMSKTVLKQQPSLKIYFILYFIAAILSNVFFTIELIGRVLNYFKVALYIILAASIFYSKKKYEKILAVCILIVYILLFNYLIYQNIWVSIY